MKKYLLILGLFLSINASSQEIARNTIFAEASGVTGLYSVNYERLLFGSQNVNLGLRGGLAYNTGLLALYYNSRLIYPISLSLIKNIKKNHFLELRAGFTSSLYTYKDYSGKGLGDSTNNYVPKMKLGMGIIPSIGIGYRYQPKTKGLFFNFLTQRILYFSKENWYGNFSVGLGYTF